MDAKVSEEAYLLALQNAVSHEGKADVNAVLGRIMAKFKGTVAREAMPVIADAVARANSMTYDEQVHALSETSPDLLVKQKKEKIARLRELEGAGPGFRVRLAPYPSGALHIGNSRMLILNDEYAKKYSGELMLVYDDTIGSEEKLPRLDSYELIRDGLSWLGVKWSGEYYKSDRLELFYKWASMLVEKGIAYACTCSAEELRKNREDGVECVHRSHSIAENAAIWAEMLKGSFEEGKAVLRARTDMKHKNPAFRDRVLCRISHREHPRVGRKYHVWPMLEFSWAVDDIELGMTHVIRGKELYTEDFMEDFIWKELGIKGPRFEHFGLLRIAGVKISKSKSMKEIVSGEYFGWEDPRTWSLQSLRARGFSPDAIRNFILNLGMSLNDIEVAVDSIYSENRKIIEPSADRYFFVDSPVKIKIENAPRLGHIEAALHPDFPERGRRKILASDHVYVSSRDVSQFSGTEIRLKDYCNVIISDGRAKCTGRENRDVQKVQWVPVEEAVPCEVIMVDGSRVQGFAEGAVRSIETDRPVQFERFGFVNPREKGSSMLFYYTHA